MPRPKRTKVAPPEPTTRVAESATAKQPSEMSSQASSERNTGNSDDSEGLVTKSKTGLNRRGVAPQMDMTMTGALAPEDVAGGRLKPLRGRKRAALTKIAREGDHAKAKIEELRARMEKDKAEKNRGALHGGDIVPATQEEVQKTDDGATKPAATEPERAAVEDRVSRPQTATGSLQRESSVLADFKRRPRQPSLLAMVQAKHQQQAEEESNSDDSLNDFQPEDESTPFAASKSQPVKPHSTPSARTSSLQHSSGSRKRKHASIEPEIQVPASQPSSLPVQNDTELNQYDIPADEDAPEPSLPVIQSTQLTSQLAPSTLAPPQSSSAPPDPLPKARPSRSNPTSKKPDPATSAKTKKAATRIQPSRALSPPQSPQSSPSSHPSPVRKTKTSPLKPLTTATLQNLLPRRRVRAAAKEASAFDIPSSSDVELSSDQDELSLRRAPKTHHAKKKKNAVAKATPLKNNSKGRLSTTYSRKKVVEVSSDRDDEEEAGGNDENGEIDLGTKKNAGRAVYGKDGAAVKGEMRRLAQKFREVDEWALEIEDVTPHSGSSQMVDAR